MEVIPLCQEKVCTLRPVWRWEHIFLRAKVISVSCPYLQSSTGLPLSSVMLNYSSKISNHPRLLLLKKDLTKQTHGQHTYRSRHLECWEEEISAPHHIHSLLIYRFLGWKEGKATHTYRSLAVQEKDEERLILSIALSVFFSFSFYCKFLLERTRRTFVSWPVKPGVCGTVWTHSPSHAVLV